MRLFLKSFARDAGFWFQNLKLDWIGSWEELHDLFLKYWGENKSYDQFISEFYSLKRENDEPITKFIWRFQSFYISIPTEIKPSEKLAMVYYVMAQHLDRLFPIRKEIIIFKTIVWGCKRSGGEHWSLQNASRSGSCWRYTSLWTRRRT